MLEEIPLMTNAILKPEDWTDEDTRRARQIWEQYPREHDLTDRKGQTAGIDPQSGEVWVGKSAIDFVQRRKAQGLTSPLSFERIGYATDSRQ